MTLYKTQEERTKDAMLDEMGGLYAARRELHRKRDETLAQIDAWIETLPDQAEMLWDLKLRLL